MANSTPPHSSADSSGRVATDSLPGENDALILVTLPPAFGMRNLSPFCLKIGEKSLADSELIGDYLEQRTGGAVFAGLNEAQKGHGWAATRLAEDHLDWLVVDSRWLDERWWPHVVDGFLYGATPNYFDYSVAGVLSGIYDNTPATWLTTVALDHPDLREYTDRVQSHVGIFGRYV